MARQSDPENSLSCRYRRGFEVLIRKLLAYKHKPAVIVLHWWSPRTREFWESAEDELEVFSK